MGTNKTYNLLILLGVILGGILGHFSTPIVSAFASGVMELFVNLLKLISLPMIFLAIISTLTTMNGLSEARRLLGKILKYTIVTTLISASVGLTLFILIKPAHIAQTVAQAVTLPEGTYFTFLKKIIPENILQPFHEDNVLGVAFISAILSIAILKIPHEKSQVVKSFFQGLFEAFLKITKALIAFMPIAIFAFMFHFVESIKEQKESLDSLLFYGLTVIGANLIQGLIVLPLFLKMKKQSPKRIAKGMMPALMMAFFSKSSNGTLPLTLECAQNRVGVSEKTSRFSLPLCSVINMNGCAAFILITTLFVCASNGIVFSIAQMIPWIFIATIAAIGNAGVPMGCFFLTSALLLGMGVPLDKMGIILPLYSLFDMVETCLNVWSDSCVTTVVDREVAPQSSAPTPAAA